MSTAAEPSTDPRLATHRRVAARLDQLSDRRLAELVRSVPVASGMGGRTGAAEVDGTPVFVKRIPLTDLELRPEHLRSTANHFGLPLYYQYGFGSSGFGAWRELAVHLMTTHWALGGEYDGFPLTHHWRVLPDTPFEGFADEFGGIDGAVAHWGGSPAVRTRLEAIGRATHSVVLFLEYVPGTLGSWLHEHGAAALPWVEEELARGTAFLRSRGLVHFDAHFHNLLTDGRRVHFADYGLALSSTFELDASEREFFALHRDYDRHYVLSHLLRDNLLAGTDADAFLSDWTTGHRPEGLAPEAAAAIDRHARTALLMGGFHRRLLRGSRSTPYPAAELELVLR
ncbi:protein kinase family protein [Kitasatospora sp. NPDC051170]|uniref:protein kinase family protein n=1 Tax=Kitasatospora sp. NPDC051170 TaxID=3364056 RepID=UPI0037971F62